MDCIYFHQPLIFCTIPAISLLACFYLFIFETRELWRAGSAVDFQLVQCVEWKFVSLLWVYRPFGSALLQFPSAFGRDYRSSWLGDLRKVKGWKTVWLEPRERLSSKKKKSLSEETCWILERNSSLAKTSVNPLFQSSCQFKQWFLLRLCGGRRITEVRVVCVAANYKTDL